MGLIKNYLLLTAFQRRVCKKLESSRGRLHRMAHAWTHNYDRADEIVQETMIKALRNADQVKDPGSMNAWLFRILSNCFLDDCRKQKDTVDIDVVVLTDATTPENEQVQDELVDSVRSAIAALPVKHRQVVTLIDIEGFSYAEVSGILNIPPGTVMSRLNRARLSLRESLEAVHNENKSAARIRLVI